MNTDDDIKKWEQPVKDFAYLLERIFNLSRSLVFYHYGCTDGSKQFSNSCTHKARNDYQRMPQNTYNVMHIETNHNVI